MAISYVTSATGTTGSTTISGIQPGDLVILTAFRRGTNTQPTIPSGWTAITGGIVTNNVGSVCVYQFATATSLASGTFVNSFVLHMVAYRGVNLFSPIGGSAVSTNTGTTVTYPAVAMSVTNGTSWIVGFGLTNAINSTIATAPTGMTHRSSNLQSASETSANDTNGGVSSWSAVNESIGGTSTGWGCYSIELQAATGPWSIVQSSQGSGTTTATATFANTPTPGNWIVADATQPTITASATPTIADGNANAFTLVDALAGSSVLVGTSLYVWKAGASQSSSVIATGVSGNALNLNIYEVSGGISSAVNGTLSSFLDNNVTGSATSSATVLAESLTTTLANSLVWVVYALASGPTTTLGNDGQVNQLWQTNPAFPGSILTDSLVVEATGSTITVGGNRNATTRQVLLWAAFKVQPAATNKGNMFLVM